MFRVRVRRVRGIVSYSDSDHGDVVNRRRELFTYSPNQGTVLLASHSRVATYKDLIYGEGLHWWAREAASARCDHLLSHFIPSKKSDEGAANINVSLRGHRYLDVHSSSRRVHRAAEAESERLACIQVIRVLADIIAARCSAFELLGLL